MADWVYDLPAFSNLNGVARAFLGGWQVSGVFTARSGGAITITQNGLTSRPDYVSGDPVNPNWKHDAIYLNTRAFARVPLGAGGNPIRPGSVGVGAVRGPSFWGADISLGKNFGITESMKFQIRADAFNALNYTPYNGLNSGINSAAFGLLTSNAGARQIQLNGRLVW
jgi:hypothetical protein